jgi:hypothetical protein
MRELAAHGQREARLGANEPRPGRGDKGCDRRVRGETADDPPMIRALTVLTVAAVAAVAGCGGSEDTTTVTTTAPAGGLSKPEYIEQADAVCQSEKWAIGARPAESHRAVYEGGWEGRLPFLLALSPHGRHPGLGVRPSDRLRAYLAPPCRRFNRAEETAMATMDGSNGSLGPGAESSHLRSGSWAERIAYSEAWSRSLNERGADWAQGSEARPSFRCECWQQECTARISLSRMDWTMVRAEPSRFAVAPDHVAENFEAVVKTFPGFWLIEKFGEAGKIAEELAGADLTLTRPSA